MLITRLYLRNFRVYEDELTVEMPPGVVGIYGPNGSGKSTLLEAILFALWGKSRTGRDLIRTAGVLADCVCEVELEHEGHLYTVRRTVKGVNSSSAVEVSCDGSVMATATRDAQTYVESILGLDVEAFRASVFAEQKQLAAFSAQRPEERRRLIMALLGITPLDGARDSARRDARECGADHERLRSMLPDLDALAAEAADSEAAAAAAEVVATEEVTAAAVARRKLDDAERELVALDVLRQRHEQIVLEGKAARDRLDRASLQVAGLDKLLAGFDDDSIRLRQLDRQSLGLDDDARRLELLLAAARAANAAEALPKLEPPGSYDESKSVEASGEADRLAGELAAAAAYEHAAGEALEVALAAKRRAESISGEATCPTCGQTLGESFEALKAHHQFEVDTASSLAATRSAQVASLRQPAAQARLVARRLTQEASAYRERLSAWEEMQRRRQDAHGERVAAWLATGLQSEESPPDLRTGDGPSGSKQSLADEPLPTGVALPNPLPSGAALDDMVAVLRATIADKKRSHTEALVLRGRFATRADTEASMASARLEMQRAAALLDELRRQVKALGYRPDNLEATSARRNSALKAAQRGEDAAQAARLDAARRRERASGAAARLSDARAQHAKIADLETRARHLARTAELLARFRDTVVASVGPRLAQQAAALFGELTDNEYEDIQVDPDTYQLQIRDGGELYGLDRFSGSEIDLANLALRVAISEHINFQSGGAVGLLVLDEVFGPLDDDRKARMLLALEHLRGRFRQILVVTHDPEIKEQLPNAIEVVKLPGRRASARLVGD